MKIPKKDVLELKNLHKKYQEDIQKRLLEFQQLPEQDWIYELLFCILTPQSSGKRCWEAIEELKRSQFQDIEAVLARKTRFHKTKAKNLQQAKEKWPKIQQQVHTSENPYLLREYLFKNVKGLGMKESSHFIRNIGKNNNTLAILDRHILGNLARYSIIKNPKINLTKSSYLKIEQKFLKFSQEISIPIDHLDLLFWKEGAGEIFK